MRTPSNILSMDNSFSWSELLGGGLTTLLVTKWFEYRKRKRDSKIDMAQSAKDIAEVYRIMRHVTKVSMYDRMLVVVGEDSAGVLSVGKNLYVSCQYEVIDTESSIQEVREDIQRWRADADYYDIYSDMLSSGCAVIKTSELPNSKLKTLYQAQNIKSSFAYHLMTTKDYSKVFYCSIASSVVLNPTDEDKYIIESAVDRLSEIFNRHKKYY